MSAESPVLKVQVETVSLRERTTEVLRNAIISMHFAPGEKLVERRLCEETGVSRTSVREALRHLEAEGLVTRVPGRGIRVARLSVEEARQIYEMRAIIEARMSRNFVRNATPAQRQRLEDAFTEIERHIAGPDLVAYAGALQDFSDAILDGSGNALARQFIRNLGARITFLRVMTARVAQPEHKAGTLDGLRRILQAVRAGDADAAAAAAEAFVERSAAFALEVLARHEDPTSD